MDLVSLNTTMPSHSHSVSYHGGPLAGIKPYRRIYPGVIRRWFVARPSSVAEANGSLSGLSSGKVHQSPACCLFRLLIGRQTAFVFHTVAVPSPLLVAYSRTCSQPRSSRALCTCSPPFWSCGFISQRASRPRVTASAIDSASVEDPDRPR